MLSFPASLRARIPDLRHDSEIWRRAMRFGAVHGPEIFIRYSPALIGMGFALAMPTARKRVQRMLEATGQDSGPAQVARVFSTFALSLTEAFAIGGGRRERLTARIVGDSNFQRARALGRGVIVATAHTSGWYAAGPVLGSVYEDEVILVMQRERDASAESVQDEARKKLGLRVVHVGDDPLAAMPLVSHLRNGGIVALQIDRVPAGMRGVETQLLGNRFAMPEGAFKLAAVSGAPIVLVLGRREAFLRYEVQVGRTVLVARRADELQIAQAARELAMDLEAFVRSHPTHWFHFPGL